MFTGILSETKVQFCLIGTHQLFSQFKALLCSKANKNVNPGDYQDCRTSGTVKRGLANTDYFP